MVTVLSGKDALKQFEICSNLLVTPLKYGDRVLCCHLILYCNAVMLSHFREELAE